MGIHAKDLGKMIVGNNPMSAFVGSFIIYFIVLVLILLFGEYLWNNILVKYVTVVKPINSIWHLLGIILIVKMIFC
tara:strand:+ start:827 stop:1054 length:228 start_codon:yes stop_codon:yes gene_type:complete